MCVYIYILANCPFIYIYICQLFISAFIFPFIYASCSSQHWHPEHPPEIEHCLLENRPCIYSSGVSQPCFMILWTILFIPWYLHHIPILSHCIPMIVEGYINWQVSVGSHHPWVDRSSAACRIHSRHLSSCRGSHSQGTDGTTRMHFINFDLTWWFLMWNPMVVGSPVLWKEVPWYPRSWVWQNGSNFLQMVPPTNFGWAYLLVVIQWCEKKEKLQYCSFLPGVTIGDISQLCRAKIGNSDMLSLFE